MAEIKIKSRPNYSKKDIDRGDREQNFLDNMSKNAFSSDAFSSDKNQGVQRVVERYPVVENEIFSTPNFVNKIINDYIEKAKPKITEGGRMTRRKRTRSQSRKRNRGRRFTSRSNGSRTKRRTRR